LCAGPLHVDARLASDNESGLRNDALEQGLRSALAEFENSKDPPLRRLHAAVSASPAAIRIRPNTDDRTTWSTDGNRPAQLALELVSMHIYARRLTRTFDGGRRTTY